MNHKPKFQIYQDKVGEWRWRLVAGNGRIVADGGEGYTAESKVLRAVVRLPAIVRGATPFART